MFKKQKGDQKPEVNAYLKESNLPDKMGELFVIKPRLVVEKRFTVVNKVLCSL